MLAYYSIWLLNIKYGLGYACLLFNTAQKLTQNNNDVTFSQKEKTDTQADGLVNYKYFKHSKG